ncbi:heterokaryon incompatibility protein-domain-containing protein [Biscogniauxia marginata]|nr:heterokaryon incompatibility protein-domain-containing protein [Biscogniauxia marginata]
MGAGRLSSADLVAALQKGLRKCKELHGSKCQVTPPEHIPDFWVIDTQENYLVPGNSVNKYAALSYVWRSPLNARSNQAPAERLMLQRNNLDSFRKPGFLSSESGVTDKLPEVIRDSIDFVQQSGVRYLWVDCLCIAQNDETTDGNVLSMREIYSGAYFTIIAAATSSGSYGLGTNVKRVQNEKGVPDAGSLHGALLTTHWATRGWTFQEQMLSKRSFVFLDDTAFWDCQDAVWWSESLATSQGTGIDELNVSGVLDALTRGFLGGFISGLPAVFLDSALLWQPLVKARRRVRSDEKAGPSSPLPSCLKSGLDYEVRYFCKPGLLSSKTRYPVTPYSRRTRKLVDWISSTTVDDECKILEPGILEQYKGLQDNPSDENLPDGWSHKTKDTDPDTPVNWLFLFRDRPTDWYSHESDATSVFRYPLPMRYTPSTVGSQGHKRFLSCTTFAAKFNVRRVLFPYERVRQKHRYYTQLYRSKPDLEIYCPVITLEDSQGRWAGLLRVMDDNKNIEAHQTVEVIAILQGSSSLIEAAVTYEEMVDRLACYRIGGINSDHCHFALTRNFQQEQGRGENEDDTSEESIADSAVACYHEKGMKSECYKNMEKEANRLDQGPFFLNDIDCSKFQDDVLPREWKDRSYDFYNVLWVERKDNFMERKAAGRVPKDIWEKNQGAPRKIRLG